MSFEDVPEPFPDQLCIYVIGPGFGESQVIHFPDGRWAVVDCCLHNRKCAPLGLLKRFGVDVIDLLVVTHPDLDHIEGLPQLIDATEIREVWRFPQWALLKPLIAWWLRQRGENRRLQRLSETMEALDPFFERNIGSDVVHGHRAWPYEDSNYGVHAIAPCTHDANVGSQRLRKLLTNLGGEPEPPEWLRAYLTGNRTVVREDSNAVSLALSIEWGQHRVLLGGDVHNAGVNPESGWAGVLKGLSRFQLERLVEDLAFVKVAHHGSLEAFWREAWSRHSANAKVPLAAITPFTRSGNNPPPHYRTLQKLSRHVETLGITSSKDAQDKARSALWKDDSLHQGDGKVGVVGLFIAEDGTRTTYLDKAARAFVR